MLSSWAMEIPRLAVRIFIRSNIRCLRGILPVSIDILLLFRCTTVVVLGSLWVLIFPVFLEDFVTIQVNSMISNIIPPEYTDLALNYQNFWPYKNPSLLQGRDNNSHNLATIFTLLRRSRKEKCRPKDGESKRTDRITLGCINKQCLVFGPRQVRETSLHIFPYLSIRESICK